MINCFELIYRVLLEELENWRVRVSRKPVVLRGARQVGKTTLIKEFGKQFDLFIYLNLERDEHYQLLKQARTADQVIQTIFLDLGEAFKPDNTLIFFDEVQEAPHILRLLRYLHEDFPQLAVVAAGSLLEHALKEVESFPVGRIEYIVVHPLNFMEFLHAVGNPEARKAIEEIPVLDFAHPTLMRLFHEYAIIGGMPEIVDAYRSDRDFSKLSRLYDGLMVSYLDDVEKYARNQTDRNVIRHLIRTAPTSFDNRIKLAGFGNSSYRGREVKEGLASLEKARLLQVIYPTTSMGIPALPDLKKSPRLQFLDTGLINHALGIQSSLLGLADLDNIYRGHVVQHLVTQELISVQNSTLYKPHFWVREKSNSTAEVDLVCQHGAILIPIEVKAGSHGRLRSLHQFIDRADHHYAVRLHANSFSIEENKTPSGKEYYLMNMPYYLGTKIPQYLEWFVKNY